MWVLWVVLAFAVGLWCIAVMDGNPPDDDDGWM